MNDHCFEERDFLAIQYLLSHTFYDQSLLEKALFIFLPHPNKAQKEEFKRLVFYGEAILSFIVSKRAYHKLAHLKEGALARLRTQLVKEDLLKEYFFNLSIHEKVPLVRSYFAHQNEPEQIQSSAKALKALIAALYTDADIEVTMKFFNRYCLPAAKPLLQDKHHFNWRRKLQEWCEKYKKITPKYLVLEENGPEHAKTYKMGLFIEDELLAKSEAPTKKKAANLAASQAFNKVRLWQNDLEDHEISSSKEESKPA